MPSEVNPYEGSVVLVRPLTPARQTWEAVFVDGNNGSERPLLGKPMMLEEALARARTFAGWFGITHSVRVSA